MKLLPGKNVILLIVSIALISIGFTVMRLEPAPHGYGPWALTVAPSLVLCGFTAGFFSIFFGSDIQRLWKHDGRITLFGWGVFVVSLLVYVATLEETASLWDCAEFIACAYKLQVPHAPGAPMFLMIGRMFSLLSLGDELKVAYWVNMSSAVSSAMVVMFTFWVIIMMIRLFATSMDKFTLIIAGLIGSFVIAFADSFWFSAVEAETYAMATLFLILAFWAILKWRQSNKTREKWLLFIFYVLGLSIGVHPMSLLVLPGIAIIMVFDSRSFSWKALIAGAALGALAILFLNHVVLFGLPDLLKYADVLFVNGFGMPFYTGAIAAMIVLLAGGFFIYRWSIAKQRKLISILTLGLFYFLIGYSSYFMILIRSQQDPSIDENNPENLMTLASYLKRESYGSRPFVYGRYFNAKVEDVKSGAPVYTKMDDKYTVTDHKLKYVYEKHHQTILPRMYSNDEKHIQTYRQWTGLKDGETPSFIDNLNFMIRYQIGHMYMRYLLFNFSGRLSDIQHAEWLAPWDITADYPDQIKKNKTHNNFLMIPFILGILGMIYHYRKDKAGFWALMAFFLFLGIILVFYLNAPPNEPRERDYIYVGSYLAFTIWCGIGAYGAIDYLSNRFGNLPGMRKLGLLLLGVPALMLIVGFDDHDRSDRTLQVDHARNILNSCAPNAILFTGGDNDTFPLWYVQEVEGFRTDVRVIVLSYFNGDWYIDQMQRKVYESDALPFSLEIDHYRQGGLNDVLPFVENSRIKGAINLEKFIELVRLKHPSIQVDMSGGAKYNSIPSRTFFLDIDAQNIHEKKLVPKAFERQIQEKMLISWKGNFLEKSALMVLDLIVQSRWERPIYFNITSLNSISLDLKKHVVQEGLVYRFLPIQTHTDGAIDLSSMYENLIDKADFKDLSSQRIYYNHEDYQLRILQGMKSSYNTLANGLLESGDTVKASETVHFISKYLVSENINLDLSTPATIALLFKTRQEDKALSLATALLEQTDSMLKYLQEEANLSSPDGQMQLFILRRLYDVTLDFDHHELAERCAERFNKYVSYLLK